MVFPHKPQFHFQFHLMNHGIPTTINLHKPQCFHGMFTPRFSPPETPLPPDRSRFRPDLLPELEALAARKAKELSAECRQLGPGSWGVWGQKILGKTEGNDAELDI